MNKHIYVVEYIYIYIYIYSEMVNFGESDQMIKISEKMEKSDTYKWFSSHILFFFQRLV